MCLEPSGCQASGDHWLEFGQEGSSQGRCRPEWEADEEKRSDLVGGRGGVRIKSFLFMTKTDFLEFISEWRVGGIYYFLYMRRQKIKCFPSLVRVK